MAVETHEIRLRGPWQVRLADQALPIGTVQLPGAIRFEDLGVLGGCVDLVRVFPWVAPRSHGERIYLVLPESDRDIDVSLNNRLIDRVAVKSATSRLDLTEIIKARNELALRVDARPNWNWVVPDAPTLLIETQRGTEE